MASINFILKSNNNPSAIYVRLIDGRKTDVMAKTNFSINPAEWSTKKQQPKNLTSESSKRLNSDLKDIRANLLKHYNSCNGKVTINTHWLKDFINPSGSAEGYPTDLLEYTKYYIENSKKNLTESSIKKFNVVKHKLERFEKEHGPVIIKDVGRKFQEKFETYCIKHNYAPNTIARELRFIKTVCRHAKSNGVDTHYQLDNIKVEYKRVDSIYLNEQDLEAIKKVKLNESLDNVRDWLLISCYTGQRVSDFLRFEKSMIRYEENRTGSLVTLIEFVQQKTSKRMSLPLHKEVIRILEKRQGDFPPAISDQKYNEYIKTVCRKAGITEIITGSKKTETKPESGIFRKETGTFAKCDLVSSHIGRRSFATNFYGKVPTSLLIAATGHSTEQMFLNYIGKSSADMAKELAEYF